MTVSGNGIFILVTKDPGPGNGYEYRVAYSEDIATIYGKYDDSALDWTANHDEIWKTFKACFFSTDISSALARAREMSNRLAKETECGIMTISTFRRKTWDELINGA